MIYLRQGPSYRNTSIFHSNFGLVRLANSHLTILSGCVGHICLAVMKIFPRKSWFDCKRPDSSEWVMAIWEALFGLSSHQPTQPSSSRSSSLRKANISLGKSNDNSYSASPSSMPWGSYLKGTLSYITRSSVSSSLFNRYSRKRTGLSTKSFKSFSRGRLLVQDDATLSKFPQQRSCFGD